METTNIEKINKEIESLLKKQQELSDKISTITSELDAYKTKTLTNRGLVENVSKKNSADISEMRFELNETKEKTKDNIESFNSFKRQQDSDNIQVNAEIDRINATVTTIKNSNNDLVTRTNTMSTKLTTLENNVYSGNNSRVINAEKDIAALKNSLDTYNLDLTDSFKNLSSKYKIDVDKINTRIDNIKTDVASFKNTQDINIQDIYDKLGNTYNKQKIDSFFENYYKKVESDNKFIYKSGDTVTGAINFANNTWNKFGDDVLVGDKNVNGCLSIKSNNQNYNTGIAFHDKNNESDIAKLYYNVLQTAIMSTHPILFENNTLGINGFVYNNNSYWRICGKDTTRPSTAYDLFCTGANASGGIIYLRKYVNGQCVSDNRLIDENNNTRFQNAVTANTFYANDWFRCNENCGIYWQKWGGGWYMSDNDWMRVVNNKSIYTAGRIRCDGGFEGVATRSNFPNGFGNVNFSNCAWGNQDGRTITSWITPNDGCIDFRENGNTLNVKVDGLFYQSEGRYRVLDERDKNDILSRSTNVAILTGTINNGGTIPLPSGFSEPQCKWMVSVANDNPPNNSWDIEEHGYHLHYKFVCYTEGRRVISKTLIGNIPRGDQSYWLDSIANYIVIGVR